AATRDQCIEIRAAEPIRGNADAARCADGAAGLGQQTHVIDGLTELPVREFEGGDHGAGHHREAWEDDETNALHGASRAMSLNAAYMTFATNVCKPKSPRYKPPAVG